MIVMNKHAVPRITLLLILSTIWATCVDNIDFEVDSDVVGNLAISGKIVKGVAGTASTVTVAASRVLDFSPVATEGLTFSKIEVVDEDGNSLEVPGIAIGKYQLRIPPNHPTFKVEVGKKYGIRLTQVDGTVYASDLEEIEPVTQPFRVDVDMETRQYFDKDGSTRYQDHLLFDLKTNLRNPFTGNPGRLRWDVIQSYSFTDDSGITCYIEQFINDDRVRILDGNELDADSALVRLYEPSVTNQFAEGAYITFIQESLTPGAYDYWSNLVTVNNRTGNMFEQPVGKLRSNIHRTDDPQEDVFGYFYATQQDTFRRYVTPAEAGNPVTRCPFIPAGPTQDPCPQFCCDCTRDPKSLHTKPRYWTK